MDKNIELLEKVGREGVRFGDGNKHYLDTLEELRKILDGLLKKEVLECLMEIKKDLEKEPKCSSMYSWFVRNSTNKEKCSYSIRAIEVFKRDRLDRIVILLEEALQKIRAS